MQIVVGLRFRFIEVIRHLPPSRTGVAQWLCRCDCGKEIIALAPNLRRGDHKSCGCRSNQMKREAATIHGGRFLPEYRVWQSMLSRCRSRKRHNSRSYAGKGVSVCSRWARSFASFLVDVGPRPSPLHSLDRFPNGDGDYEPGNVRWATDEEQRANKGNRILVEVNGATVFLKQAAAILNITIPAAYGRYRTGTLKGARRDGRPSGYANRSESGHG